MSTQLLGYRLTFRAQALQKSVFSKQRDLISQAQVSKRFYFRSRNCNGALLRAYKNDSRLCVTSTQHYRLPLLRPTRHYASYTEVLLDPDDEFYYMFQKQKLQHDNRRQSLWAERSRVQTLRKVDVPLCAKMYLQDRVLESSEDIGNFQPNDSVHESYNNTFNNDVDDLDNAIAELFPGVLEDIKTAVKDEFVGETSVSHDKEDVSILEKLSEEEKAKDLDYGIPDPDIPISNVPCPGCGAKLQCQDTGIPGYMPSEKFKKYKHSTEMLKKFECHRCYIWSKYEMVLDVSVPPEEYKKIVAELRNKFALVIVVVDLTDIPNSIYKGLLELVGHKHPLYIVGNKVDLIPKDGEGYLRRIESSLSQAVREMGLDRGSNVKHTCLVSARTGYGIEELITRLMKEWNRKGDVCVVGCTNAGKSTLFNALLTSDYCKSTVRDLIHSATTSIWPGTTLSLLKFPIVTAKPWKLHLRSRRILKDREDWAEEQRLENKSHEAKQKNRVLTGNVGITFIDEDRDVFDGIDLPSFSFDKHSGHLKEVELTQENLVESEGTMKDNMFLESKWFYDSPGVVNPDQVINLLTQEELTAVIPKDIIKPRTFVVQPQQVVLVGGLGRLDYIEGKDLIYCTVFCTPTLPISVLNPDVADSFYARYLYSGKLVVPSGDESRLNMFPSLVGKQFSVNGLGRHESTADILLSSAGWISITATHGEDVTVRAYTPGGRGCRLRQPSMLPLAVNVRGRRMPRTSAFEKRSLAIKN